MYDLYHRPLIVAGHSKGGNLATYAAAFCNKEVLDHIITIYSFDGPGFSNQNILHSAQFNDMKDKLITFSARISLVAIMLYHVDDIEFLNTRGFLFMQHAAFNWKIEEPNRLKRIKENSIESKIFGEIVEEVMKNINFSERKKFGKILFTLAKENPKSNLVDIKRRPISYFKGIYERKKTLSKAKRTFYNYILRKIRYSIKVVLRRRTGLKRHRMKTLKKDFRI